VHLSASDPGFNPSGVASIKYKIDGGSATTVNADNTDVLIGAPSDHSNDGVHTITYWATDNAGNVESPYKSATVKIDTIAPSLSVSHSADGSNGWNKTSPVSVTVNASDGGSGLDASSP